MSQKVITTFTLLIFILLMILVLWMLSAYYADLTDHISQFERLLTIM